MQAIEFSAYCDYADNALARIKELRDRVAAESASYDERVIAAGRICEYCSNVGEAAQLYASLVARDDYPPESLGRLAIAQLKLGQIEAAFQSAVLLAAKHRGATFENLGGKPFSALTVLGDAQLACGNREAAMNSYREALSLVPDDARAGSQYVQLLAEAGRIAEATEAAAKVQLEPNRGPLKALLGLLRAEPGKPSITKVGAIGLMVDRMV